MASQPTLPPNIPSLRNKPILYKALLNHWFPLLRPAIKPSEIEGGLPLRVGFFQPRVGNRKECVSPRDQKPSQSSFGKSLYNLTTTARSVDPTVDPSNKKNKWPFVGPKCYGFEDLRNNTWKKNTLYSNLVGGFNPFEKY